ncbi:MAG: Na(+)-translocating NADH-quinone reductase subunit F [Firmicutes bacterium ADurb.Bin456]|nr:MAG: Na(+)-translocating NADH-quinone reductase subunit F [Firmicutes bacterium ADurb.Bin456]
MFTGSVKTGRFSREPVKGVKIVTTGKVYFELQDKKIEVPAGTDLLQTAAMAGVPVEGDCGGKGTCGKCRIRILTGGSRKITPVEERLFSPGELAAGWVLACRQKVTGNLVIETPGVKDDAKSKARQKWQVSGAAIDPSVQKYFRCLNLPAPEDRTPDLERLVSSLPGQGLEADLVVVAGLPRILRQAGFKVTAVLAGNRIVAVEPGNTCGRSYGLALDLGTTTLAGYLVDLIKGKVAATSVSCNPQAIFGADVISRIRHAAYNKDGLRQLQEKMLDAVNGIIRRLQDRAAVQNEEIYETIVVGNTTMVHLFLGIEPSNLALTPFIPAFNRSLELRSTELGLNLPPAGRIQVLPSVAGFVGSDTVAMLLAAGLDRCKNVSLAVDIGTNGEVALAARDRILVCSSAAGSAFEGYHIEHGMRAVEGAIDSVVFGHDVQLGVIGGVAPRGICGSGLIDAVAGMLGAGIIDSAGRFVESGSGLDGAGLHPRLRSRLIKDGAGAGFLLAPGNLTATGKDIVITQKDIKELQLAKAAIAAGVRVLLQEMGISAGSIHEVLLAGAFGSHVRKESALAIGLLPPVSPCRIRSIGNAAGDGAILCLISRTDRNRALSLCSRVEHIDLSSRADFYDKFVDALPFTDL